MGNAVLFLRSGSHERCFLILLLLLLVLLLLPLHAAAACASAAACYRCCFQERTGGDHLGHALSVAFALCFWSVAVRFSCRQPCFQD